MPLYLIGFVNFDTHAAELAASNSRQQAIIIKRKDGTAVVDYVQDTPLYKGQNEYKGTK